MGTDILSKICLVVLFTSPIILPQAPRAFDCPSIIIPTLSQFPCLSFLQLASHSIFHFIFSFLFSLFLFFFFFLFLSCTNSPFLCHMHYPMITAYFTT